MWLMTVTNGSDRYGPIRENFHFDLVEGYTALVSANNAGKSALLQLIFRSLFGEGTFGAEKIALIPLTATARCGASRSAADPRSA